MSIWELKQETVGWVAFVDHKQTEAKTLLTSCSTSSLYCPHRSQVWKQSLDWYCSESQLGENPTVLPECYYPQSERLTGSTFSFVLLFGRAK